MLLDQEQKQKKPEQTAQQAKQENPALPAVLVNMKAQYGSVPPPAEEMAAKLRAEKAPLAKQRLLNHMQSAYGNEYSSRVGNLVMAPEHEKETEQPEEKPQEPQEPTAETEEPELKAAETEARKTEAEPDKTPPAPAPAQEPTSTTESKADPSAASQAPEPATAPESAPEAEAEHEEEETEEPTQAQAPETAGGDENGEEAEETQSPEQAAATKAQMLEKAKAGMKNISAKAKALKQKKMKTRLLGIKRRILKTKAAKALKGKGPPGLAAKLKARAKAGKKKGPGGLPGKLLPKKLQALLAKKKGKGKTKGKGPAVPGEQETAQTPTPAGGEPIVGPAPVENAPKGKQEQPITGGAANRAFQTLAGSPASIMAQKFPALGQNLAVAEGSDRQKLLKETPAITAQTSGMDPKEAEQKAADKGPPPPPPGTATPFDAPGALPVLSKKAQQKALKAAGKKPKDPNGVATDAGPAPKFKPSGAANPDRSSKDMGKASGDANREQTKIQQQLEANNGADRIQPRELAQEGRLKVSTEIAAPQSPVPEDLTQYQQLDLPDSVRNKTDQKMAPSIQGKIDPARQDFAKKLEERDVKQEQAIKEAEMKAGQVSDEAQKRQDDAVTEARGKVAKHKEDGLRESREELDKFNSDATARKAETQQKVDSEISNANAKSEKEIQKGKKQAEEEKRKAKAKEKKEKKEYERKKKKRKWYQKIGDFFKGLWNAFKKAVTSIVNAVVNVVKKVIAKVQELANKIIEAATKLVNSLLDAFASVLKSLVTNLIGSVFPALAEKINGLIDEAVNWAKSVVEAAGQYLKDALAEVVNTLNQMVDFVSRTVIAVLEHGPAMLKALLTGDFMEFVKQAFMMACDSAGLPGEELWGIILKAGKMLWEIAKNPGPFLKNLIAAGKKGLGQFVKNLPQHILTGLMGWIFGKFEEAGITLPKSFSWAGLFDLVRQILGLTWQYVRDRAASIIGEENMERIEHVAEYFKLLFESGPGAVWEKLKDDLGMLKTMVMEEIKNWIIMEVVQKGITKVVSMLIPGAGIIQAVWGMWQTFQFFLEYIKEIAQVVNGILNSIGQIAKGAIGAAANYIENTMVKTLPLVFAWLAKLIGIGDVAGRIRSIVDKLRTPVNKVVDTLVGTVLKGASAVKKGVVSAKNKVTQWWKERMKITTKSGALHEMFFTGNEMNAVPMVASDNPMPVTERVSKWKAQTKAKDATPKMREATPLLNKAEKLAKSDPDNKNLPKTMGDLFDIFEPAGGEDAVDSKGVTLADLDQSPEKGKRSKEEMEADLKRVNRILEIIVAKTETTSEIEAYFPKIIKRYGLSSLCFSNAGGKVSIDAKINPEIKFYDFKDTKVNTTELMTKDMQPDVRIPKKGKIAGEDVGMGMEVLVTPKHPEGKSPKGTAQQSLFEKLPTKGKVFPPNRKGTNLYIKGHLLNDNLGGPGDWDNLFPITQQANVDHESAIENDAKTMVNSKLLWAYYKVDVEGAQEGTATWKNQQNKDTQGKYINASLKCTLAPIILSDQGIHKKITKQAVIKSEYDSKENAETTESKEYPNDLNTMEEGNLKKETGMTTQDVKKASRAYRNISELSDPAKHYLDDFADDTDLKNELTTIKSISTIRRDWIISVYNHGLKDVQKKEKENQTKAIKTINTYVKLLNELLVAAQSATNRIEKIAEKRQQDQRYDPAELEERLETALGEIEKSTQEGRGLVRQLKEGASIVEDTMDNKVLVKGVFTPSPQKEKPKPPTDPGSPMLFSTQKTKPKEKQKGEGTTEKKQDK